MGNQQAIDFLAKYAELAEEILVSTSGKKSATPQNIEKVATYLINEDMEYAEAFDTVDTLVKEASIAAHGFYTELVEQLGQEKTAELINTYLEKVANKASFFEPVKTFGKNVMQGAKDTYSKMFTEPAAAQAGAAISGARGKATEAAKKTRRKRKTPAASAPAPEPVATGLSTNAKMGLTGAAGFGVGLGASTLFGD